MSNVLLIETATEICSVGLISGNKLIAVKENHAGRTHAAVLSVFIKEIFDETGFNSDNLDAIAVSEGPGSYTGLRIGVSTAKGICYGSGIPLIAIPTMESMCAGFQDSVHFSDIPGNDFLLAPMIDARRMEVYTSLFYADGTLLKDTHALIVDGDTFNELLGRNIIFFFGNGADKFTDIIKHPNARFIKDFRLSSAYMANKAIAALNDNRFVNLAYFEPYYLKDFVAIAPKRKVLPHDEK